jgi:hypothetical protein
MVAAADHYRWSSAATHRGGPELGLPLRVDRAFGEEAWGTVSWREFLEQADAACDLDALRASTQSGRPLGAPDFVKSLEHVLRHRLVPQKGWRPRSRDLEANQGAFRFA